MCLNEICSSKEKKKYLKRRGDMFKVYKVVRREKWGMRHYLPELYGAFSFRLGLNIDETTRKFIYLDQNYNTRYPAGFHAFTTKKGAQRWMGNYGRVVACYVKSSWVHTLGRQSYCGQVIVTKKIIMPGFGKLEPGENLLKKALAKAKRSGSQL